MVLLALPVPILIPQLLTPWFESPHHAGLNKGYLEIAEKTDLRYGEISALVFRNECELRDPNTVLRSLNIGMPRRELENSLTWQPTPQASSHMLMAQLLPHSSCCAACLCSGCMEYIRKC
jgi:hypothetical protein